MATRDFSRLISDNERWLMRRVLEYARAHGYTRYTSTLEEAWRVSIAGLNERLLAAWESDPRPRELGPDEDYTRDPAAAFGILEAQRHRSRGITLPMFLGLMKYYRQAYVDLVEEMGEPLRRAEWRRFVDRFFDRVELGFISEWGACRDGDRLAELQAQNRSMTNEKNKYLTIFESLSKPVFLLNEAHLVENANHAAVSLFLPGSSPGAVYYRERPLQESLPWLFPEFAAFASGDHVELSFEKRLECREGGRDFQVRLRRMLDVSGKFTGTTVILTDITELHQAWEQVNQLTGLLPICANCKKIRDDQGYWQQVETYIADRSQADFTHGICPECMETLYPGASEQIKRRKRNASQTTPRRDGD